MASQRDRREQILSELRKNAVGCAVVLRDVFRIADEMKLLRQRRIEVLFQPIGRVLEVEFAVPNEMEIGASLIATCDV